MISDMPVGGWIVIALVAAFFILFFVLMPAFMVVAGRFETRHLHGQLISARTGAVAEALPYLRACRRDAEQLGLLPLGDFRLERQNAYSRGFVSIWLAPERDAAIIIEAGHVVAARHRKTVIISVLAGGDNLLSTQDEWGEGDIGNCRQIEVLMNADLNELYSRHRARLQRRQVDPLPTDDAMVLYEHLERIVVERLIAKGLACYLAKNNTSWRYTWFGAIKVATVGYARQLRAATPQQDRTKLKRPGDRPQDQALR